MVKIIFLLPVIFLCAGFVHREANYCKIVDSISKSYLKECAQPHRLMLSGYGGAMMDDIQEISISFLSRDAMNVDEARKLYVEMMEDFLRRINSHEEIRPHLHNFPFEDANIKLSISFVNSEGRTIQDGHVALMGIAKDHILYFAAYNPHTENFYTLCEEPYAEARKQVMRE